MLISQICIKRPVFATVLSLIIVLVGVVCFNKLPIRGAPAIDPPIITINASYNGASAEYMEKNVTNILERAMRTIKGVDYVASYSSIGSSKINIFFKLNADINIALSDVRSQIASVAFSLPFDMQAPQASKVDGSNSASMFLIVSSNKYSALDLTDIIQKQIAVQLERIPSVGSAVISGGKYYSVKINVDPVKLYQYKLDLTELQNTIVSQNIDYPSGLIKTDKVNFVVNLNSRITNPEDFKKIVLKNIGSKIIKLEDVADVVFEEAEATSILRCNSEASIGIGLVKQSDSNILELSKQVISQLPAIQKSIPQGINIDTRYDQSLPVGKSIESVFRAVIESLLLVFLVVYLFLGSMQATLIPFVTIPISLIGTFALMSLCGFSINLFSMLAMVLAIGLVVDDAIVVLENSYRYCQKGFPPLEAAEKSIREVGFAVIAMTTTLVSVFLPIGFMDGFVGMLFTEFAWTLAFCVMISGFVAITLTPMMCARMISCGQNDSKPKFVIWFEQIILQAQVSYLHLLDLALEHKKSFISICLASIGVLILCFIATNKTFIPLEDDGMMMMFFTSPEGSSLAQSDKTAKKVQQIVPSHPDVENFIIRTGEGKGFGFITLKDWSKRANSQEQIRAQLTQSLAQIPESLVYITNIPSILSGPSQKPVEFNLQGINISLNDLNKVADAFIAKMRLDSNFRSIEKDLKTSTPGININIDKDQAQIYGISPGKVGTTLTALLSLQTISYFLTNDLIYNVIMEFALKDRSKISDLNKIYVKSNHNTMIPITNFASINEVASVQSYNHYNNVKTITVTADLADKASFGQAAESLQAISEQIIDTSKVKFEVLGNLKRMKQQSSALLFVFAISILFIYLILSAQFESFTDPLLILCSVPFSMTGALFALFVCGNSINLYSNIGIITLIGLVTKNAILIIEFANQLIDAGNSVLNSIKNASATRFRPILMTSISTALGALPLVCAHGPGAAARCSIGLVIFGGIIIGTIFTLFVIPFLYANFKNSVLINQQQI